jgi:acyl carrier protein
MTRENALSAIREALQKTLDRSVDITEETDLIEAGVLDSLDGMVFLLELETASGCKFPEGKDLVKEGYYHVNKLLTLLTEASSPA